MFKLSHQMLVFISGTIWFAIGCFLMILGLGFLTNGVQSEQAFDKIALPIIDLLAPYVGGVQHGALIIIVVALYIGYVKGRHVLGKSARKGVERIRTFPNPTSLTNIYSAKYYLLIALMIGLGLSIKYFGLPLDVRGFVDVAIGSALINGSLIYYRSIPSLRKETSGN